jgi:hypothetical protein
MAADQVVLLAAGPRDLPLLLICAWRRRPFVVYLQVPYTQAITWRDPLHATGVLAFLGLVHLLARRVLANSGNSARALSRRKVELVWPLTASELRADVVKRLPEPAFASDALLTIDVVCRLAIERGIGSRDVDALARLLRECRERHAAGGSAVRVRHFGECSPRIQAELQRIGGPIVSFEGYHDDWVAAGRGPVVLLSRYEGFGLAAFEASRAGRLVYVNEAFPDELILLCPSITRILTSSGQAILDQVVHAW